MCYSILYKDGRKTEGLRAADEPECFADLNLDQVFNTVITRRQDYDLLPLYYTPVRDVADVLYRQEVSRELEQEDIFASANDFAQKMVVLRRYLELIHTLRYPHHREGWVLEAILIYCDAVHGLNRDLAALDLASDGLVGLGDYVAGYVATPDFAELDSGATRVKAELAAIQYSALIKGNSVRVQKYEGEADLSQDIESTFEKFRQGAVKDYRAKLTLTAGMNHVGAQILDGVASLFPDEFGHLEEFVQAHSDFLDATLMRVDREVQFYLAYLQYVAQVRRAGLTFCYPQIAVLDKELHCHGGFDLALAHQNSESGQPVVPNDFNLAGAERIIVVSGPNQGGKTTFARMFGQVHYLAGLGLPVPGQDARLYLADGILTHFEREEDIRNLRGKLYDDVLRVRHILEKASPDSIIIMNEIFSSTALQDAVLLSTRVMEKIIDLDLICVCVTFLDELASLSDKTVSMASTIVAGDPASRTFKIIRRPADGLAYAMTIAQRHGLTRELLKERIKG